MVSRIIFPSIIHQKSVLVSSGKKHGRFFPHSVVILFHGMLFGIPLVEISHQDDLTGIGRFQ
jgi:hypothetical protein